MLSTCIMQAGVKKVHVHVYLPGCLWHHLLCFAFLGKVCAIGEGSGSNVAGATRPKLNVVATLPKLGGGTPSDAASQQIVDALVRLGGVILDSTSVLQRSIFSGGVPPGGTASLQSVPGASCTFDGGMAPVHRRTATHVQLVPRLRRNRACPMPLYRFQLSPREQTWATVSTRMCVSEIAVEPECIHEYTTSHS